MVKLLACGASGRGKGFEPRRDMAEISLKRRKFSKQPNPKFLYK